MVIPSPPLTDFTFHKEIFVLLTPSHLIEPSYKEHIAYDTLTIDNRFFFHTFLKKKALCVFQSPKHRKFNDCLSLDYIKESLQFQITKLSPFSKNLAWYCRFHNFFSFFNSNRVLMNWHVRKEFGKSTKEVNCWNFKSTISTKTKYQFTG